MQGQEKEEYFKNVKRMSAMQTGLEDNKIQKIRYDVLRNFMFFVSQQKASQWISSRIFTLIKDAAEESSEALEHSIDMWHQVKYNMSSLRTLRALRRISKWPLIGFPISLLYHQEVAFIHEMIYIFCTSLTNTMTHERKFIEDMHVRN